MLYRLYVYDLQCQIRKRDEGQSEGERERTNETNRREGRVQLLHPIHPTFPIER
jgi:hypothetical protein